MANPRKVIVQLKDLTAGQLKSLKERFFTATEVEEPVEKSVPKPKESKEVQKVVVSFALGNVAKVFLIALLVIAGAVFLYEIQEILLILFVAFFLATALFPTVEYLRKWKLSRGFSTILIYLLTLTLLGVFARFFAPVLAEQVVELARNIQKFVTNVDSEQISIPILRSLVEQIETWLAGQDLQTLLEPLRNGLNSLGTQLGSVATDAVSFLKGLFNGIFNFILVLVLTFFLIVERESVLKFIVGMFPKRYESYIDAKAEAMQVKIGYWLQGQVILMLVIGVVTYIGLLILGVDYALTLAVFSGLAELLPVIGPLIAFLVVVPVAANQSIWLVLFVAILFFIVQQLENNVFVPMIMKKALNLSPIVIIVAMLIGHHFLDILGLILSIPVAATLSLFVSDLMRPNS